MTVFAIDGSFCLRRQQAVCLSSVKTLRKELQEANAVVSEEDLKGRIENELSWQKLCRMFMKSMIPWLEQYEPKKVYVCWDQGRCHYRVALNPEYKLNRVKENPTVDQVYSDNQYFIAREWLHVNLPIIGLASLLSPGIEADDLAYYLASRFSNILLISDDNDWHLNLLPGGKLLRPMQKSQQKPKSVYEVSYQQFHEKYNLGQEVKVDPRRYFLLEKVFYGDTGEIPRITTPKKADKIVAFMTGRSKTLEPALLQLFRDSTKEIARNVQLANTDWLVSRPEIGDGEAILNEAHERLQIGNAANFHTFSGQIGLFNYASRWKELTYNMSRE